MWNNSINESFIRCLGQKEARSQLKGRIQELFKDVSGGGVPISGLMVPWGSGSPLRWEIGENCQCLDGLVIMCVTKNPSVSENFKFEDNSTVGLIETVQVLHTGMWHVWIGLRKGTYICVTLKTTSATT